MEILPILTVLSVRYRMDMCNKTEWIRCPVCGAKTRDRIREDTVLKKAAIENLKKYFLE